jgi:cytochrome c553
VPLAVVQNCVRCHGIDGVGRGTGAFPKLAGQRRNYLENALKAYATGERHSGTMGPISAGLKADAIPKVARYYSQLAPSDVPAHPADQIALERGRTIAEHGIPQQRVPSCVDCHAPEGQRYNPNYPALEGQYADYLVLQLELFKKGHRGGSDYSHLMEPIAKRLQPDQMRDVAQYFESLRPPQLEGHRSEPSRPAVSEN